MLEKGAWSRSCCTPSLRGYRVHLIDISIIYGRWSDRLLKPCRLREKKEKKRNFTSIVKKDEIEITIDIHNYINNKCDV